jgi:hypothetical protein
MPQQPIENTQNNFTKGFKTEYTSLNFPEDAATDVDNTYFDTTGKVSRRYGFDYEDNKSFLFAGRNNVAIKTFKWTNAGGDGQNDVIVSQIGNVLYFYLATAATETFPLSNHVLNSTVNLTQYSTNGFTVSQECEFSQGNGYLFVHHPFCEPFYCTYNQGIITPKVIVIKIRDFVGVTEGTQNPSIRPSELTSEHLYNLINQGWTQGAPWSVASSTSIPIGYGSVTLTVPSGVSIDVGSTVTLAAWSSTRYPKFPQGTLISQGIVSDYTGTSLTITVNYIPPEIQTMVGSSTSPLANWDSWNIYPVNYGYIGTWFDNVGNWPSNADVWWRYKNTDGEFDPATMYNQISLNAGFAPKGHIILNAMSQIRTIEAGIQGITEVSTSARPSIGTWFQGRIWYSGVNAAQVATGDVDTYTWTNSIYFSQTVTSPDQFGMCYQINDPTSETLFDLLPTDGGVIQIQEAGKIHKLFPIQNGLLVFADNGIWFITGSRGIGFAANDYTVTKISDVRTQSPTSFVNVLGLPYFWNEEGIYTIKPAQEGLGLIVQPLVIDTIQTFYDDIPNISKYYVKGDYNPLEYTIQWLYKDTTETSINNRYEYNKILIYNVNLKAFYVYTISEGVDIHSINFISGYGSVDSPDGTFKYFCSVDGSSQYNFTFAEEKNEDFVDWYQLDNIGKDYESYFITGYRVHGQGLRKFQAPYVYVYSNADTPTSYKIQGIWDYSSSGNSGKWTTIQLVTNALSRFFKKFRRHRIRGRGVSLQIKISSVKGMNYQIEGWAVREDQNTGL